MKRVCRNMRSRADYQRCGRELPWYPFVLSMVLTIIVVRVLVWAFPSELQAMKQALFGSLAPNIHHIAYGVALLMFVVVLGTMTYISE